MLEGLNPLWAFVAVVALGAPLVAVIGLRMRPLRVIDLPTPPPSPARFRAPAQSAAPPIARRRAHGAAKDTAREVAAVAVHVASWVVPLALAAAPPALIAGSISPLELAATQHSVWYVVAQPLAFIVYVAAIGMMLRSGPAVTAVGPLTRRAIRGAGLLVLGTAGAYLFLGGDDGWVLPPFFWLLAKTVLIAATATACGGLAERAARPPATTRYAWTLAMPVALLNLVALGLIAWLETPR